MLEIEIDGKCVEVPEGSTVMEAAQRLGIFVPHFCYHKKLSIAASCRMCLVEVEKAPKPLPACATPVTGGMKVLTRSPVAVGAQKGVMEFLLANHPLDCPICDQGGECQLQDLAVGYGGSHTEYNEEKRVVPNKELGSLISTDMTRCIHCTRCVRFGQEIAGVMELGVAGRGEHSEIMTFVGEAVDSEVSGNMIDLCPVGALTSKPFRYSARTWELSRRRGVSAHDSLGSNLAYHVKHNRVYRTLPVENEAINECWLSDRDRFAYEGFNAESRVCEPMIKRNGQWQVVDWQVALACVAEHLLQVQTHSGGEAIAALGHAASTLEELFLLQKIVRGLGSSAVESRLRKTDYRDTVGMRWLGMSVSDISSLDRLFVIGADLRKEQPLLSIRVRKLAQKQLKVSRLTGSADDWAMPISAQSVVAPSRFVGVLASVLKQAAHIKNVVVSDALLALVSDDGVAESAHNLAEQLCSGKRVAIWLGAFAEAHPDASILHALTAELARIVDAKFGFLGDGANAVGAQVAGAVSADDIFSRPRKAFILMNTEPEFDCADTGRVCGALAGADFVLALSAYTSKSVLEHADVILPVSPISETSGTMINLEGTVQRFYAAVRPQGNARPAWKVLRVLGNALNLPDFEYESSESVRDDVLGGDSVLSVAERLSNTAVGVNVFSPVLSAHSVDAGQIEMYASIMPYATDAVVRRSPSLQATVHAQLNAGISPRLAECLGVVGSDHIRIESVSGFVVLPISIDDQLADSVVRVPTASDITAVLGSMFGWVKVEKKV